MKIFKREKVKQLLLKMYGDNNVDNTKVFVEEIRKWFEKWKFSEKQSNAYGKQYEVKMIINGVNDRKATVKTGWIIENDKDFLRLVSGYIYKI